MLALFNRIRISAKLPAIMVAITLLAVAGIGTVTVREARDAIEHQAEERLRSLASSRTGAFQTWLGGVQDDLIVQAKSTSVQDALRSFTAGWSAQGDGAGEELRRLYVTENPNASGERWKLANAEDGSNWTSAHDFLHANFVDLQQRRGYEDVLLFDQDGNLIYSVSKADDFGTNFVDGPYADSALGEAFRAALALEAGADPVFVDFAAYAPSEGIESFIALPVYSTYDQLMGVVAYELPNRQLNGILLNERGLGETGQTYLVGADGLLRSGLRGAEQDVALERTIDTEAVDRALAGESGSTTVTGAGGQEALAIYQPVSFLGTDWAMIAEEDTAELFGPATRMRSQVFLNGAIAAVVISVVGLLLSRNISAPLGRVGAAMHRVAGREYDVAVPATDRGDEIGHIAKSLESFRASLQGAEAASRDAAFKSAAFEGSSSPLMMVDTDFTISFVNESMMTLFRDRLEDFREVFPGFDPDGIVGQSTDIFHACPAHHRARMMEPEQLPFVGTVKVGGAHIELRVASVYDAEGGHVGAVLEWQDKTAEIRNAVILNALDASQARIEMALDGQVRDTNAVAAGLFATDLVGQDGRAIIEATNIDGDPWARAAEGQSLFGRFRIAHDGRSVILDGGLSPITDRDGKVQSLILLANDVTEAEAAVAAAEAERKASIDAQAKVVQALGAALEQLSNGDMTVSLNAEFTPENERLREDFNRAMGKLLSAMRAVVENSGAITGEVHSITQAANELSSRTENQAATLEETAAALDELTASVKSSAERAAEAAQVVDEARSSAEASGTVVREAVSAMGEIEASSEQISKIIGVIDDIAFQTNLLALNAGVEAARAGDAGRGFAVVASEVRALAQRSSDAAREINGLISSSGDQVKRGVDLVGEAGKALEKIVASVGGIAGYVGEMASSSSEQSQGLVEINQAMTQLDQVTQQNAAMFEETSAASQALARAADALSETVGMFRTGSAPAAPIPFRPAAAKAAAPAKRPEKVPQPAKAPEPASPARAKAPPAPGKREVVNAAPQPAMADDDGWAEF